MAKSKKGDYFGLSYLVSVILAIIPVTAWFCGFVTRFSEGKIVAGLVRLIFGFNIVWTRALTLSLEPNPILRNRPNSTLQTQGARGNSARPFICKPPHLRGLACLSFICYNERSAKNLPL